MYNRTKQNSTFISRKPLQFLVTQIQGSYKYTHPLKSTALQYKWEIQLISRVKSLSHLP